MGPLGILDIVLSYADLFLGGHPKVASSEWGPKFEGAFQLAQSPNMDPILLAGKVYGPAKSYRESSMTSPNKTIPKAKSSLADDSWLVARLM